MTSRVSDSPCAKCSVHKNATFLVLELEMSKRTFWRLYFDFCFEDPCSIIKSKLLQSRFFLCNISPSVYYWIDLRICTFLHVIFYLQTTIRKPPIHFLKSNFQQLRYWRVVMNGEPQRDGDSVSRSTRVQLASKLRAYVMEFELILVNCLCARISTWVSHGLVSQGVSCSVMIPVCSHTTFHTLEM